MIYGGEGKYTKPLSWNFFHTRVVKRVKGLDFVYLPSLSYHSYLVCELFGMLSLHYLHLFFLVSALLHLKQLPLDLSISREEYFSQVYTVTLELERTLTV